MTGTKVSYRTVSAYADFLSIPAMVEKVMMEAMQEAEKPEYTEDYAYAAQFAADENSPSGYIAISPADQTINLGSTDVGDVSWQVPDRTYRRNNRSGRLCPSYLADRSPGKKPAGPQGHALRGADSVCGCEEAV
ncbi:MAG: hypothetical protein V8S58_09515 [Lachnospiraceae bacterium]